MRPQVSHISSHDHRLREICKEIEGWRRVLRAVSIGGGHITFQPRIRCWMDKLHDIHLGGDRDGFQLLLQAVRVVTRGGLRSPTIPLVSSAFRSGRAPVRTGVVKMFEGVRVSITTKQSTQDIGIRAAFRKDTISIRCTDEGLRNLYVCVCEAMEGEGDFSLRCGLSQDAGKDTDHRIWFWGFANIHGANGF